MLVLLAAPPAAAPPADESLIWRTAIRRIIADEGLSPNDLAPVSPRTYFPHHLRAQIAATPPDPLCAISPDRWPRLMDELARVNRHDGDVVAALTDEPGVTFVDPPMDDDYLGLSRVLLIDGGQRALWSISISNLAGAIVLHERDGNAWSLVWECAEWTSY